MMLWVQMTVSLIWDMPTPARYTDKASGITLGLNWYLNPLVRLMVNYNHVKFNDPITVGGEQIDAEDVILTRFELTLE